MIMKKCVRIIVVEVDYCMYGVWNECFNRGWVMIGRKYKVWNVWNNMF